MTKVPTRRGKETFLELFLGLSVQGLPHTTTPLPPPPPTNQSRQNSDLSARFTVYRYLSLRSGSEFAYLSLPAKFYCFSPVSALFLLRKALHWGWWSSVLASLDCYDSAADLFLHFGLGFSPATANHFWSAGVHGFEFDSVWPNSLIRLTLFWLRIRAFS